MASPVARSLRLLLWLLLLRPALGGDPADGATPPSPRGPAAARAAPPKPTATAKPEVLPGGEVAGPGAEGPCGTHHLGRTARGHNHCWREAVSRGRRAALGTAGEATWPQPSEPGPFTDPPQPVATRG